MSVNWIGVWEEIDECESVDEIKKLWKKCGGEEGKFFGMLKSGVRSYCYGRDYRKGRSVSMSELRKENERLRKENEKLSK